MKRQPSIDPYRSDLEMAIRHEIGEERVWKTAGLPGVEVSRRFARDLGNSVYRTVEPAVSTHAEGGYEIYVYGLEVSSTGQQPNPDLPRIQNNIRETIKEVEQTPRTGQQPLGIQDLGYEIYHLSYLESDRAIALLKVLGYTTIEYSEQEGETVYDKIYAPVKSAEWRLPVIVKLIDATKTSLMDPSPAGTTTQQRSYGSSGYGQSQSTVPDIGGYPQGEKCYLCR